ncbi:MAG: helix-turn-helix domain-containing protein [Nanoarchaeota archaeon]
MSTRNAIEDIIWKYSGSSSKIVNEDITERLSYPFTNYTVGKEIDYRKAKEDFLKRYIIMVLTRHSGNITYAAEEADVSRRTVHRMIRKFGININRMRTYTEKNYSEYIISDAIETSVKKYETKMRPKQIDGLYKNLNYITRDIMIQSSLGSILTLREAEQEFEKKFFQCLLERNSLKKNKIAKKLGIRSETLHRKIKSLNLNN